MNFVQLHACRIPVERVLLHHDHMADLPALEHKGPVADEMTGPRPAVVALIGIAVPRDRRQVHRPPRIVIEQRQEIRHRPVERDAQSALVERLCADTREVLRLALVVILSALHDEIHVGVLASQRRRERSPVGAHEVVRRHRIAVRPADARTQMKRVGRAVR